MKNSTSTFLKSKNLHDLDFAPVHETKFLPYLLSVILLFFFTCTTSFGSGQGYHQAMKDNLQAMDEASSLVEKQTVANQFERIATAEKDKWLPYYYAGMLYTLMSFETADPDTKDKYAEKAAECIYNALNISPEESELHVLQALNFFALIQADPMERGMLYMNKANAALSKAKKFNAENPRIYFLRGQTLLNLPAEFGGGKEAALPVLLVAKEKYQQFIPLDDIHPKWGKEDVEKLLDSIKQD